MSRGSQGTRRKFESRHAARIWRRAALSLAAPVRAHQASRAPRSVRVAGQAEPMSTGNTAPVAPRDPFFWASTVRDVRGLYYKHFGDHRRERQLFSTGAFFVTFASVRAITHAIRTERGPFKNITAGGRHIHHMTIGIAGLLAVGYLWLLEIGTNDQRGASRMKSIGFGSGAALTLDEFALWLNLEDDYWTEQGRESIDAVILFGALVALSVLGKGFAKDVVKTRANGHSAHAPSESSTHEPPPTPAGGAQSRRSQRARWLGK